jgi:hypothetical protein
MTRPFPQLLEEVRLMLHTRSNTSSSEMNKLPLTSHCPLSLSRLVKSLTALQELFPPHGMLLNTIHQDKPSRDTRDTFQLNLFQSGLLSSTSKLLLMILPSQYILLPSRNSTFFTPQLLPRQPILLASTLSQLLPRPL